MDSQAATGTDVPQSESRESGLAKETPAAVVHLRDSILAGKSWHTALLEAAGLWSLPQEEFQGRHYRYLILGEAFELLALAERLLAEVDGLVPQEEKELFLLSGRLPEDLGVAELKHILGLNKYRAYLNYWYGGVVEEALQLAVEEEVRKARYMRGYVGRDDLSAEVFSRLYGDTHYNLLCQFREEMGRPQSRSITLTEMKEFTYWLFRRRVKLCEPARLASDTRKGVEMLARLRGRAG